MRRHFALILSAAVMVGAIAAAAPAMTAPAPPQESTPMLRIVKVDQPVLIRGLNFKAGERVRLTGFVAEKKIARTLTSSLVGTFTANLGYDVHLSGCSGAVNLKAVGSLGSVAILKLPPKLCAVAAAP
jgi:hypothetical protein